MTPRKLSESDKNEIINLYRQPGETTVTLANRYGVSNSTISRILKSSFSEAEYAVLVQQKRDARFPGSAAHSAAPVTVPPPPPAPEPVITKLRRRRSVSQTAVEDEPAPLEGRQLELLDPSLLAVEPNEPMPDETIPTENPPLEEMLGQDLLDREDFSDLDEEDEEDQDLEEDLSEEDEYLEEETPLPTRRLRGSGLVRVLPLSEASLPKICYLVVDRAAELIARPLRDFGDLGQIPTAEIQQKTLPVFDNHRVARRFSNRSQRVIKVPDGRMLQKTSTYLQAKGITRLLIDGQVYSI